MTQVLARGASARRDESTPGASRRDSLGQGPHLPEGAERRLVVTAASGPSMVKSAAGPDAAASCDVCGGSRGVQERASLEHVSKDLAPWIRHLCAQHSSWFSPRQVA